VRPAARAGQRPVQEGAAEPAAPEPRVSGTEPDRCEEGQVRLPRHPDAGRP